MGVHFYGCVSMDGYLADSSHGLKWLHETGSSDDTGYNVFYASMDITLMGRRTFDAVAEVENPHFVYPTTKNYVFTHSKDLYVSGFTAVSGDIVSFVRALPAEKNVWVVGGSQVLAPLLNENMVDKMIIQIAPVLLGKGISLFTQEEDYKRFTLEQVNRYGEFAELVYHRLEK